MSARYDGDSGREEVGFRACEAGSQVGGGRNFEAGCNRI